MSIITANDLASGHHSLQPDDGSLGNPDEEQFQPPTCQERHLHVSLPASGFSMAPFIHHSFSQSQVKSKDDFEFLLTSLFGLSNVTLAFGKTVGHWNPDWQNHREAEEANVHLDPMSHLYDPYLANLRVPPSCRIVSTDTRDEILGMILKNCAKENVTRVASAFPSAEVFSQLLLRFFESHALEEDTWVHIATFDANKAPSELVMAFAASSAMQSTNSDVRRFGKALNSILHPYLFQVVRSTPSFNRFCAWTVELTDGA
jgi:hypothetical protein